MSSDEARASDPKFNRVHAICTRLRDQPCKLCPSRFKDERYGWMVKGCYALADEVRRIAVHGNPWGKKAKPAGVKAWRRRFNRE